MTGFNSLFYSWRLAYERRKLALSEWWLGFRSPRCTCGSFSMKHMHAPDCPATWGDHL